MSFNTEVVLILRHVIDDVGATVCTDARLQELCYISALLVETEVSLGIDYLIDVDAETISPDPTDPNNRNNPFINLIVMKAACLLSRSEAKTAAGQSLDVRDGKSFLGLKGYGKAKLDASNTICEDYEEAKKSFVLGSNIPGHAIVSPFPLWYKEKSYYYDRLENQSFK